MIDHAGSLLDTVETRHRSRFRSRSRRWMHSIEFFGMSIMALVAEAGLVALHAIEDAPAVLLFLAHLIVVGILVLWVYTQRLRRGVIRTGALLTVSTLALGPVGVIGAMLANFLYMLYRRSSTPFENWYQALFPDKPEDPARDLYYLIISGRERGASESVVSSFSDLLRFGTLDQKQAMIALLARHFRPRFAPILHAALRDEDPSIRVQAATAVARIEDEFVQKWIQLEARARARPSNFEVNRELAQLLDDYAFTDLMDKDRESDIQEKALAIYKRCVELRPNDISLKIEIGRLLLRREQVAEAAEWLAQVAADPEAPIQALGWYAECLYRLKRLDELRQFAMGRLAPRMDEGKLPEVLERVTALWLTREAAE